MSGLMGYCVRGLRECEKPVSAIKKIPLKATVRFIRLISYLIFYFKIDRSINLV